MFPLSNGKLIRLNKDGSNGEVFQSNKTNMVFGTSIFDDHHIKDVDPAIEFACEISTDEYGRVSIKNKSPNEIFVNDKELTRKSVRPLFNNNIIKIGDGVEFRWVYKQAKENNGGDLNDADFASWSDPAKKHMKLTREQRPKGRLTAHPLNMYSSALEDIEKDVLSTASDDERSTGCSVIPTELNDSVFTTQSVDVPNVTAPLIDVSQALINFDETQIIAPSDEVSEEPTSTTVVKSEVETSENLMNFDVLSEQSTASVVKSQPSNCSVITLSSDGSQEAATQENMNKNVDFDDEEMFERSISCPPTELPDDLFENCDNEDTDNMESTSNTEGADTTDKVNVKDKTMDIKAEENESKVVPRRSSIDVNSDQQVTKGDTSIEQLFTNDDDDVVIPETQEMAVPETEDFVIPETQEIFSQDSYVEMLNASCSIIDCEKSEYSFESKGTVSETIKQNISIGQPNMSVVSISSDEGQEVSRIESVNENVSIQDSENMFETETFEEHQQNVDIKAEVSTSSTKLEDGEQSKHVEQTNTFDESATMFSHSLSADVDKSITDTKTELLDNSASNTSQPESTNTLQESEESGAQTMEQEINTNTLENNLEPFESNIDESESVIPAATDSNISTCMSTDTTQELNLLAFNSEFGPLSNDAIIEQMDEDTMDKLEFSSSDSIFESNDSGNITASCVNTSSVNVSSEANQSGSSSFLKSTGDISMEVPQTPSKINNSIAESTIESPSADLSKVEESPSNELEKMNIVSEQTSQNSNSQEEKVENVEIDTKETQNKSANLIEDKAQDNSESSTFEDELNIEQNEKVGVESPQSIDDIVAYSTPTKIIVKSDENHGSTVTRSSRRKQPFSNVEVTTPKQTPRKLNESVVVATPRRTETTEETQTQVSIEPMSAENEPISKQVNENVGKVIQPISTNEDTSTEDANVEVESEQVQNDIIPVTPVKTEPINKIDVNATSSVTRSTRRKPNPVVEFATPKQTPKKLHMSIAPETPCKSEEAHNQENIESQAPSDLEREYSVFDSTLSRVFATPAKVQLGTPKQTPRKLNKSVVVATPCETETTEPISNQVNENVDKVIQPIEDANVQVDFEQVQNDIILATPVKTEPINKINESATFSVTRSTRRKPNPVIEFATPKQTPKKLETSLAPETPCKFEEGQVQENTASQAPSNSEREDSVFDSTLSRVFATPAKVQLGTPKQKPRKLNESVVVATPCETKATEETQAQVSIEPMPIQNEPISNQVDENVDEVIEPIPSNEDTANDIILATPVKIEAINKIDVNATSSVTRSTRRKPNPIIEFGTPKQTPKKLKMGLALETPRKTEEAHNQENTESQAPSNLETEDSAFDSTLNRIFATPAKIESSTECNFTMTRSTKSQPENHAIQSATSKQTPRKLNVSLAVATPCKPETTEETQVQGSTEPMPIENEPISKQVDENVDKVIQPISTNEDTSTEDANVQVESEQVQNDIILATPVKTEPINKIDESATSSVTRSTRRKPNPVVEFATPKQTPKKLKMSLALETPCKSEEAQVQKNTESQASSNSETEDSVFDSTLSRVFATPAKVQSGTPKQKPRKLNESVVVATPCETETTEETQAQESIEPMPIQNEPISNQVDENVDEVIEPIPSNEDTSNDIILATPTKIEAINKIDDSATSSVTRSTRRKPNPVIEFGTPKQTPKKLHMSLAPETPCKFEEGQVQENTVSQAPSNSEREDSAFDSTLNRIFATPAKIESSTECNFTMTRSTKSQPENHAIQSATSKQTPRKLNVSLAVATPCKTETTEETQVQENIILATPVKTEPINKIDESATSSVTRSTRRKPNPVIEFATPKQTPKKLKMSLSLETPRKTEEAHNQENTESQAPSNLETEDSVFDSTLSDIFATPAKVQSGTPKQTPRKLNKSVVVATSCRTETTEETQTQVSIEPIPSNDDTSTEDANVEVESEQVHNDIILATPTKIEAINKIDDSATSSVTRSTRRKPNPVVEFATPKQTPKKLHMSIAPGTPCKSEEAQVQKNTESQASSNSETDDSVFDSTLSDIFATPARVESTTECNSTINRSTKRQPENPAIQSATPKQTPRKLDVSFAVATPCKTETTEEPQVQVSIETDPAENKPITPNKDTNVQVDSSQIQNDITCATPKIVDDVIYSVTRSTRRKPNTAIEFATPKQTPKKLNMSHVPKTPCKSESAEEGQSHGNVGSEVPSNLKTQDSVLESTLSHVFATPAKIDLDTESNSTMTRSTRRKQPTFETATPKRTPRKLNVGNIPPSSTSEETIKDKIVEDEQVTEEPIEKEQPTKNTDVAATSENNDLVSILTESNVEPNGIPTVFTQSDVVAEIESPQVQGDTVLSTPAQPEAVSQLPEEYNLTVTDSIVVDFMQNEDALTVSTPVKSEIITKLAEECNSAVIRSSKRKRADLNIGTPIAKRTPRKALQDTPLKVETKEEIPCSSTTVEPESVTQPKQKQIQEDVVEKAEGNIAEVVSENVDLVPVENNTISVENKTSADVYDRIEAELAQIHDDVVPEKNNPITGSTRNSKATRSTRRKQHVDQETPNSFNCVLKVTPLKSETLKAYKSTLTQKVMAPVPIESQKDIDEKYAVENVSKKAKHNLEVETPSTSNTPSTPPKKRGTRKGTTSKIEPSIEQNKSKDAVSDLVAAVLEENLNENTIALNSDASVKRAGTPLPASKKRTGRLTGTKAKLPLESDDKPNQSDAEKPNAVDQQSSKEPSLETETENDESAVVENGKSSKRKKQEEKIPKQTTKEKKATSNSEKPLTKRNRNLAVEPSEEVAPSTSKPTKYTDEEESKNSTESSEKAPVKLTRRKRANTDSDPVENTPKKLKTQLDHVNSAAAVATPLSLRSLRNRVISIDETSSTPKRTRQQRKPLSDDKIDEIAESVEPKDKKEEAPAETEKPKRQPRRRLPRKASVDESMESVTETKEEKKASTEEAIQEVGETVVDKKPKRATKQSRAKSKGPVDEAKPSDDEVPVKPAARRGRKNTQTQAQPANEAVIDLTAEKTFVQPAEKKPRRGRPKKVVVVEISDESETSEAPKLATKKRTARSRTVSKSEENINKVATDESAKEETKEEEKVPTKEPAKPRAKRTRKADADAVVVEEEEKPSSPKRPRNTKKAKEAELEVESSAKETVTEKKTRKAKKSVESNDTEPSNSTPRISTRTRRHK